MAHVYRSRMDRWLAAVLAAAVLVSLAATVSVVLRGGLIDLMAAVFTFALGVALPLSCLSIRYTLGPEALDVRAGPFRWHVPLGSIEQVRPTRTDWTSSPAASLDRLKIEYRTGRRRRTLMISPEDREAFLRHLLELAPELSRNGERIEKA